MAIRRILVSVVVGATLLVGCTSTPKQSPATADRTFTYVTPFDVITEWDPAISYSNEIIAMSNIYETLTHFDHRDQSVKPALATSWTSSDNSTTWTFTLRPGVTFHSGRAVTAEAAKAAIDRTKKLNQGAAYIWTAVKTIETPDPQTLVFKLRYAAPLDLLAASDYAAYIYDTQITGPDKSEMSGKDAGTGPYTVDKWEKGREVELTLRRHEKYWRGWQGPHFAKVAYRKVEEPTTAAQLLRAGQVDYVQLLTPQLWSSFTTDKKIRLTEGQSWENQFALLNTERAPLNDVRVRRAIQRGVDYDGIITASAGAMEKAQGVIPPGIFAHTTDLPAVSHDGAESVRLLSAAGYGPGKKPLKLRLAYTEGDTNAKNAATLMKSHLAALNVEISLDGRAWETIWDTAKSSDKAKRQDILIMSWWPDNPQPLSWFFSMFHTEQEPSFNLGYYSNPKLDKLIDQVESVTATDKARAAQMYRDMQVLLIEEAPALFLGTVNRQRAMRSDFDGFVDNPSYPNVVYVYELLPK